MKNIKLFENFNQDAKDLGIEIKPGKFDGKTIAVWKLLSAEGMKFAGWERAMNFLIDLWKKDEDLYNYFRGELGTSDELIVGDQTFAGSDVQDHMKLAESTPMDVDVQYLASDIEKYWLTPQDVQMDLDQFIEAVKAEKGDDVALEMLKVLDATIKMYANRTTQGLQMK